MNGYSVIVLSNETHTSTPELSIHIGHLLGTRQAKCLNRDYDVRKYLLLKAEKLVMTLVNSAVARPDLGFNYT